MQKLTDEELKKSLDAIEKVKRSCPELPRDMSINHDKYLAEMSRIVNSDYIKEIEELKKRVKELEQEFRKQETEYVVNCASEDITVSLPPASTCHGKSFIIKKIDSNAITIEQSPDEYMIRIKELEKRIEKLERELEKYKVFWKE